MVSPPQSTPVEQRAYVYQLSSINKSILDTLPKKTDRAGLRREFLEEIKLLIPPDKDRQESIETALTRFTHQSPATKLGKHDPQTHKDQAVKLACWSELTAQEATTMAHDGFYFALLEDTPYIRGIYEKALANDMSGMTHEDLLIPETREIYNEYGSIISKLNDQVTLPQESMGT